VTVRLQERDTALLENSGLSNPRLLLVSWAVAQRIGGRAGTELLAKGSAGQSWPFVRASLVIPLQRNLVAPAQAGHEVAMALRALFLGSGGPLEDVRSGLPEHDLVEQLLGGQGDSG
jgi:hypothetical protein